MEHVVFFSETPGRAGVPARGRSRGGCPARREAAQRPRDLRRLAARADPGAGELPDLLPGRGRRADAADAASDEPRETAPPSSRTSTLAVARESDQPLDAGDPAELALEPLLVLAPTLEPAELAGPVDDTADLTRRCRRRGRQTPADEVLTALTPLDRRSRRRR